ncbi:D-alanyl-D-alanine carboxypeptidase family protein [Paenibacillus tarimensis]|uniref:D-alanyl-D-alanine carboxypeptidase family protein n=1 Tax=Paenibacillus tarimensis TaxID=416012 RepID=UPI001F31A4FB|nr:D-alanyl-D-alanine carboxypeptidase family protein [Paenibacillus tarimensis]MCF2942496.1 D-alanyl-D-alanine carboxypeptidase [Paenibacillus tarimensis]
MKSLVSALAAFVLLLTSSLAGGHVAAAHGKLYTNAKGAALIDVESGRILYSTRGNERMRIASLTKIMTAIVAIEHGNLSDSVKTSRRAAGKEGSSIYLKLGEEMSLHNMLYGLMLRSGNDAATAIAEHVGGTEEGFVFLMNQKAEELGLDQTHFMNPHGLDHDNHYSSPNDMARLTAYALRNQTFKEIVKTKVKSAPNPNEQWDYKWYNKNKMLSMYEGADGVKTGYTKLAFRCLVSSATRDGQQLAAVTLNDGDDWNDHRKMLDWGFANYPLETVIKKGQKLTTVAARTAFRYPLAQGEKSRLTAKLVRRPAQDVRYALGDAGVINISLDGKLIGSVPVRAIAAPSDTSARTDQRNGSESENIEIGSKSDSWISAVRAVFGALFGGKEAA